MRWALLVLGLVAVAGWVGAWGCAGGGGASGTAGPQGSEARDAMSQARASVDIFSGREPPTWGLSAEEARAVREAVQALPGGSRPIPDVGLGYRGFSVEWPDGARARVYRDVVEYTERGSTVLREDAGRTVEQRLLAGARPALGPELYRDVEEQVRPPRP